jgi:hypothetical protein
MLAILLIFELSTMAETGVRGQEINSVAELRYERLGDWGICELQK